MTLYLADFSRPEGSKDKAPRKRRLFKNTLKTIGAAAGVGLTGYGLYKAQKLGRKAYDRLKNDYNNISRTIENTRVASETLNDRINKSAQELNEILRGAREATVAAKNSVDNINRVTQKVADDIDTTTRIVNPRRWFKGGKQKTLASGT